MLRLRSVIAATFIMFMLPMIVVAQEVTETPWTVVASGLNGPRGLTFAPDGSLFVAESGEGGTSISTGEDDCAQVAPPVGPYTAGKPSARVSRIDADGVRTTISDDLPSSQTSMDLGGLVTGATDVVFLNDALYVLVGGAGCSHALKDTVNGVYQVNEDGSTTLVADLSAFWQANPVENPQPADFEPDGTPYSMIAVDDALFVIEPNHGELDKVTQEGEISRVIDISASAGHIVPTSVVYHNEQFYIGNLSIFPVPVGAAGITEVSSDGEFIHQTLGLSMVTDIAFDQEGRLYALEASTVDGEMPTPGTGRVVRFDLNTGDVEEVVSGLTLPTAMTFGSDGALYISNFGFGFPPGTGEIVRLDAP